MKKRILSYLLAGMATPLVLGLAAALNPLPGTLWFLLAGFLPIGGLALVEEMRYRGQLRASARPGRLDRMQQTMKLDSRIRAARSGD